jgi:probable rRNA maturation factor
MQRLEIYNKTTGKYSKSLANRVFSHALKELKYRGDVSSNLILVSDQEIKKLNKKYRGKNKVTDVLSVGLMTQKAAEFVLPDKSKTLGEVIISYPQARRQAKNRNHSIKKEITILFIHGILHLLGFDHKTKKEEIKMENLENKILSKINLSK